MSVKKVVLLTALTIFSANSYIFHSYAEENVPSIDSRFRNQALEFLDNTSSEEEIAPFEEKITQPEEKLVQPKEEIIPSEEKLTQIVFLHYSIDTAASCITSSCHAYMGMKKFVHAVGVNPKHCNRCHEIVKQGEHSFKKLPSETYPLCAKCHSEEFTTPPDLKGSPLKVKPKDKDIKFHAPFTEGKCTECHDAHESDFFMSLKGSYPKGFYARFSVEEYGMCAKCHKNLLKVLIEPRTLTDTKFRNGNLNLHFRHVNKEKGRTCKICHHHHASINPKLIRQFFFFRNRTLTIEYKKTETGGSCITACHAPVKYDRYEPVEIFMKMTPRLGKDAIPEELELSREREIKELKTKPVKSKDK